MDSLWPENIGQVSDFLTPLTILQEQAELLGQRTQNIVTANVETVISEDENHPFTHDFYIVAPLLQNYRYRFFWVTHDMEMYPLHLYIDDEIIEEGPGWLNVNQDYRWVKKRVEVKDELEFIKVLKLIFSSKKAQRIVANLMNQSKRLGGYTTPSSFEDDNPF